MASTNSTLAFDRKSPPVKGKRRAEDLDLDS